MRAIGTLTSIAWLSLLLACGPVVAPPAIWATEHGRAPASRDLDERIMLIDASPTPTPSLSALVEDAIPLTEPAGLRLIASWAVPDTRLAWSPDASVVAFPVLDGSVSYLQLVFVHPSFSTRRIALRSPAFGLAFSPDNHTIAIVHLACQPAEFVDVASGHITDLTSAGPCVSSGVDAQYSPTGDLVYILDTIRGKNWPDITSLAVCGTAEGSACRLLKRLDGYSGGLALLQGGRTVAVSIWSDPAAIYLWRTQDGRLLDTLAGRFMVSDPAGVLMAVWRGQWMGSGSRGRLALVESLSLDELKTFDSMPIPFALDRTGTKLALFDGSQMRVLNLTSTDKSWVADLPIDVSQSVPCCAAMSPDWRFLAVSGPSGVHLLAGAR